MGMGIGAAMTGLRPIVEGMNMGFLLLAFNQVGLARQQQRNSITASLCFPPASWPAVAHQLRAVLWLQVLSSLNECSQQQDMGYETGQAAHWTVRSFWLSLMMRPPHHSLSALRELQ
jgi:hypothetical protein